MMIPQLIISAAMAAMAVAPSAAQQAGSAVPVGMKLAWSDEFNTQQLDTAKWSTQYYSTIDFVEKTNYQQMLAGKLPEPATRFTGHSLVLVTNDSLPREAYWPPRRKVSSIQTYDWGQNRFKTGGELVGGYLEARIRRTASADAQGVNGAFWIDSPGPDARYYMEKGDSAVGAMGIRPRGQVFEIDLCENLNTELVLHGYVSPQGKFLHNIAHYPVLGNCTDRWITHGMLWTPRGLKFYIDGKLVQTDWNPQHIKSPNHAMNVFLGMYSRGGSAEMEVDYIRFYQWATEPGNLLPNSGFEYSAELFPWEGTGATTSLARTGKRGVLLQSGQRIEQYVYLDHSGSYKLEYWSKGQGTVVACVENLAPVTGAVESSVENLSHPGEAYTSRRLLFITGPEPATNKKTVRVSFTNTSSLPVYLDDLLIGRW
ncbi:MAG: glycoside hydrolase family 16 protein [Mediterranea sp.]|jgi:hypothetical protein|nr:glycoside hydrolase family 16 protein [Mediterranea sp.]